MDSRVFCVYNQARSVLLSSKVTVADCANQPLKILKVFVSGLASDVESSFWLSPLSAVPAVPRLFPFDLLYLDKDQRVLDTAEIHPGIEFPPYRREVASALVLPLQTVQLTQTARGDRLVVCLEEEIEPQIVRSDVASAEVTAGTSRFSGRKSLESNVFREIELPPAMNGALGAQATSTPIEVVEPVPVGVSIAIDHPDISNHLRGISATPTLSSQSNASETTGIKAAAAADDTATDALIHDFAGLNSTNTPVMSITEVVLERPRNGSSPIVNGHTGDVEDLFANWVEAPSLSSAWIARNEELERDGINRPTSAPVDPTPLPPVKSPDPVSYSAAAKPRSQPAQETVKAAQNIVKAAPERTTGREVLPQVSSSTVTAVPPLPQSATFTVAKHGMWQVSMPTAVSAVAAPKESLEKLPKTPSDPSSSVAKAWAGPLRSENPKAKDQNSSSSDQSIAKQSEEREPAQTTSVAKETFPIAVSKENTILQPTGNLPQQAVKGDSLPPMPAPGVSVQSPASALNKPADSNGIALAKGALPKPPAVSMRPPLPSIRSTEQKSKVQRADSNGKSVAILSLGTRFKRWLNPATSISSDRRRAHRRYVPGMIAHYYTGGAPKPHEVADISMTGFYLMTDDRWMPETMIQMTLQKPCAKGERKQSITVLSKIVRRGSDGVAAEFVMPESLDPHSHDVQPSQTTDRFALARFL